MNQSRSVPYTRNALFRGIPRAMLRREGIVTSPITCKAGDIIFDEGDAADYLYLVGRGAVQISKALPDGSHELLSVIGPGDFFGELALYDSAPRSARATAAVPSRLARLDQEGFTRLRQIAPLEIASTLADRTIERVRLTNERFVAELASAGRLTRIGSELGALSHNLRSPLATIRNAADLLAEHVRKNADPTRTERLVEIVRGTADRALTQIDELMAQLRGDEERRTPVAVAQIMRELTESVGGFLRDGRVRYSSEKVEFHGAVLVDRHQFVAALANLVKNAIEALPEDGGSVEVSVSADGSGVLFSVSDTGSGIDPDARPLLFQRGFTRGKAGGTGIGLFHVQRVVERHGGDIEVDSVVGRGTTFRIRLPHQLLTAGGGR